MSDRKKTGRAMENARTPDPLDPESGNPSLDSEVHATTAINSTVKPEDYPKADRDQQVRAATGKPPTAARDRAVTGPSPSSSVHGRARTDRPER